MNYRIAIRSALTALTLGACSEGTSRLAGPNPDSIEPTLQRETRSRGVAGSCKTIVTFLPALPGDAPNWLRMSFTARCTVSPFGPMTTLAHQLVVFNQDGTSTLANSSVITTEDGTIFAQFNGVGSGTLFEGTIPGHLFSGTESYNGGTGKYAAVRGSAALKGSANLTTNVGQYSLNGRVSF